MFSVYKVELNGTLSNRENLGNDELDSYIKSVFGKFATIKVIQDLSGKFVTYTDNGNGFVAVERGTLS